MASNQGTNSLHNTFDVYSSNIKSDHKKYNRELNKESSFIGLHKAVASIGVSTYQRLKYDLNEIAMPKWAQIALY